MADFNTFIQAFPDAKEKPYGSNQWLCKCPAHDDKKASLSIKDDTSNTGKILIHCQAGCSTENVLAAVGKTMIDIQPEREKKRQLQKWEQNLVAEYRYTDREGAYLYSKLRYEGEGIEGKEIRYGRIINGTFQSGKGDATASLYNLQSLCKAVKCGRRLYIVEGEKDVETLRKFGITATTAGGVSDWKSEYANYFIGASEVIIVADRDDPGQRLAQQVSRDLRSTVFCHKLITPSGLHHGDVTDFLTTEEGTIEDLLEMVEKADPIFARWVSVSKSKPSTNVDLLAAEIMNQNSMFIARNPGTKSDLVFWYDSGVYRQMSEMEVAAKVREWLPLGRATPDVISKATKMIMYSAQVKFFEDINGNERYINLQNGLIDIHTRAFKKHSPELISSLQLLCNYDPEAKADKWEKFIDSLCWDPERDEVDEEMRLVLQEWTGLILSSIYGKRVKKALVLFSSQGNTGKSVYLSVISELLGKGAIANVSFKDLSSSRWATGRAFSRRCLAIGDEGGERIESSAIFKQLTGGDTVSAEMKGLQGFDFLFKGVIVAACNVLPYFEDDKGDHVIDRLMFLNCRHTIAEGERDPMLADKLILESDGIFQWAWVGLKRLLDNGMHFSRCQSSEELTAEYRARCDTMYAFLKDEMIITGNKHDSIKKSDLEFWYERYCEQQKLTALGKKNIPQRLASLGVPLRNRSNIFVYVGVVPKEM